jgi:uncharacterized membrane protein YjfL (UPF0719 family)
MNYNIALLGLVEIVSAVTMGIFILALTYKLLVYVGKRFYGITEFNLAYHIFTAAIIISVGMMISGAIAPLISMFRLLRMDASSFVLAFKYIGQGSLFIAIAYSASLLIGLISTYMYSKLTPINEFEEIKNNNVGVAIVIGSIILTLTLLSKGGVELLIEAIIPYPERPPLK